MVNKPTDALQATELQKKEGKQLLEVTKSRIICYCTVWPPDVGNSRTDARGHQPSVRPPFSFTPCFGDE